MKLVDIIKTNNVIKVSPNETVASALKKLSTSHDAAFVFDNENRYMGLINPYYCLIKSSYPSNTKAGSCLYHPPKMKISDSLNKVAKMFSESKVHYLPVFDEKSNFKGIVSARRLLSKLSNLPIFNVRIDNVLKAKKGRLITVLEEDTITTAISLFKKEKISKLVVVNKGSKLRGVLSYYDLIDYLVSPKESLQRGSKKGNKTSFYHLKVRNFSKRYVLTLDRNRLINDALNLILEKKIGSVVIIDKNRHPIGIITTKDLLKFIFRVKNQTKFEIIDKSLSHQNRQIVGGFFNNFSFFIKKKDRINKAKLLIKEEKQGGLFRVVLSLFSKRGKPVVYSREGRSLVNVLEFLKNAIKSKKARD